MNTPNMSVEELLVLWRSDRPKAIEVATAMGAAHDREVLAHRAEERDRENRQSVELRA